METRTSFSFPPFRLDLQSEQLWRDEQTITLRPKTFAVLRYLVEHAGQLVTKDELLDVVWMGTVVGDTVLKSCIRELREALGDEAQEPQYIATVHRRGYRFIGQCSSPANQLTAPTQTVRRQEGEEGRKVARKLAAILSADACGYSRLMGQDELGTIRTLTAYRAVMTGLIAQHGGRVVDAPGDNVLAEFASAVAAVECAVAIQRALGALNAEAPPEQRMAFRMGLNVGDVVVEGAQLYGEGVNIAARLEGLAEAGGLCISGTVYDQIKSKVALSYEALGERRVKNIAEPVRVYRVRWEAEECAAPAPPTAPAVSGSRLLVSGQNREPRETRNQKRETLLVGRDAELAQLQSWLDKALNGERQLVFVTGEPGIGKTTLVEAFLQTLDPRRQTLDGGLWLGWGQCIEQYGAGEAYMPILEALGRLCREPGGERLVALLNQHAPTWLVQMPTLLTATDLEALQRKVQCATRERMLREMAEAIDAITAEQPLVLWLEDLHWSDVSTLELLSLLARRREPARLLILGTYRPVDVIVREHSLKAMKQELQLHGHCYELAVRLLSEEAIEKYLAARVQGSPVCPERSAAKSKDAQDNLRRTGQGEGLSARALANLAHTIHQRTEGNPLFVVNIVDEVLAHGKLDDPTVEISTPATIRQMIEQHLERLSAEEQRVLEVASVAGMEFSTAAVAAGAETTVDEVEQRCAVLAQRGQFLQAKGIVDWPDGTITTRYSFLHALYQEVTYERIPVGRRSKLHQRIGERLEAAYGERVREIAAELAVHFEQGRDYKRAVRYCRDAGRSALHRSAYPEAITHFSKGLTLLQQMPDVSQYLPLELSFSMALGESFLALKGWGAQEVEQAYLRARALCQQLGDSTQLFIIESGLHAFYLERAELQTANDLAETCLQLAQHLRNPGLLLWAHYLCGETYFSLGEFIRSREHVERSLTFDAGKASSLVSFVQDPKLSALCIGALVLWFLGYPDQGLARLYEALTLAQTLESPFNCAFALDIAAAVHRLRRDSAAAQESAEQKLVLCRAYGFPYWVAIGDIQYGWVLAEQGRAEDGVARIRQGIAAHQAGGAYSGLPRFLAHLAEAHSKAGQVTDGLKAIAEAIMRTEQTRERMYEAELYRLKGELTLQKGARDWRLGTSPSSSQAPSLQPLVPREAAREAEECFHKAIDIARRQQAKSLELRASTSLARLWQQQGKWKAAHKLLAEIYGWFTEGFDTKDLQEAKALLEELR